MVEPVFMTVDKDGTKHISSYPDSLPVHKNFCMGLWQKIDLKFSFEGDE